MHFGSIDDLSWNRTRRLPLSLFWTERHPPAGNGHIASPRVAVCRFLSHTACRIPRVGGDDTVDGMRAIVGDARVGDTVEPWLPSWPARNAILR